MTEGRLVEWLVDEGAEVAVGDEIAEVETEKINGAVESPGGRRAAPARGRRRRRRPGRRPARRDRAGRGPDAEIDAFVAEFQASFVPGEAEEDAGGPSPRRSRSPPGTLRYLRQGEAATRCVLLHGFGGDLNNWLLQRRRPGRGAHGATRSTCPGHGGSTRTSAPATSTSLVDAVARVPRRQSTSSARTSSGTRWAAWSPPSWRSARPGPRALARARRPARASARRSTATTSTGSSRPGAARAQARAAAAVRRPGLVTRQLVDDVLKYKRLDGVDERAAHDRRAPLRRRAPARAHRRPSSGDLDVPVLVIWGERGPDHPGRARPRTSLRRAEVHVLEGRATRRTWRRRARSTA